MSNTDTIYLKLYFISKGIGYESISMPIYSQSGRDGYYFIFQNRLLSPIVFTVDEVFAIYLIFTT